MLGQRSLIFIPQSKKFQSMRFTKFSKHVGYSTLNFVLYGVVEMNSIIFKERFKAWGIPSCSPRLFTWIFKTFID